MDGELRIINFYAHYIFGGISRNTNFRWSITWPGGPLAESLFLNGNEGVYNAVVVGFFGKRVTVPEPSSVILMLLGLAGLSFARYRKQY
jgi:hypothetical protein